MDVVPQGPRRQRTAHRRGDAQPQVQEVFDAVEGRGLGPYARPEPRQPTQLGQAADRHRGVAGAGVDGLGRQRRQHLGQYRLRAGVAADQQRCQATPGGVDRHHCLTLAADAEGSRRARSRRGDLGHHGEGGGDQRLGVQLGGTGLGMGEGVATLGAGQHPSIIVDQQRLGRAGPDIKSDAGHQATSAPYHSSR